MKTYKVTVFGTYTEEHIVNAENEESAREQIMDDLRFVADHYVDELLIEEEDEDEE